MKHTFLILVLFLANCRHGFTQVNNTGKDNSVVLNTIGNISGYSGTAAQMSVTDSVNGGFFYRYNGMLPVDGGIIIKDANGFKWKRNITDNRIKPEWFGAGAELADNYVPFMKAINFIYATYNTSGGTVPPFANAILQLKGIRYNFKQTLVFTNHIKIEGEGTRYEPATILYFPANTPCLKFKVTPEKGVYSVDVKNIMVGMDFIPGGYDSTAHAISISCLVNFENVSVNFASGDGIHIDACADPKVRNYGNADGSSFLNCKVSSCNNGFYVNGCDANQMVIHSLWTVTNRRWGIYDNGFLGNHYYNPQCDFNGNNESVVTYGTNPIKYYLAIQTDELVNKGQQPDAPNSQYWREIPPRGATPWVTSKRYYTGGAYAIVNPNAYATVFGAYSEEGEAPALLSYRVITIGGDQGSGVVGGKYLFANVDGLLLTSNLVLTGQNRLGIGTAPSAPLDINYLHKDSYIPYIARFRCNDCESTNLLFSNSTSDYGLIGYSKKSFLTYVNRVAVTFTDTSGIHPYSSNNFNLGSTDFKWNTVYANNWKGGIIQPAYGGTGLSSIKPGALLVGGATATGALNQVESVGTPGQVLTSNGAGKLPSWKEPAAIAGDTRSKSILPQVMTTAERNNIRNPAEGLMIYNITTHKLNVFTGNIWEQVTSN